VIKLKPINNLECATCKHSINQICPDSNAITCNFCSSILWFEPKEDPWKKTAGTQKELLSILSIGAALEIDKKQYKIIGLTEWHLNKEFKLFWNILGSEKDLHWLIESQGKFTFIENALNYTENISPFDTIYLERALPYKNEPRTFLVSSKDVSKRYEVFGEVFFPYSTDPQVKHYEAFDENGNVAYLLYYERKKRLIWQGKMINLQASQVSPLRFNLFE
jgi:hypothetical protein